MNLLDLSSLACSKQKRLELDYDLRIAPRWGYRLEPNEHIEKAIAANQALYARTLGAFLRYRSAISAIPHDSLAEDPVAPHWNNLFLSGLDAASLLCFVFRNFGHRCILRSVRGTQPSSPVTRSSWPVYKLKSFRSILNPVQKSMRSATRFVGCGWKTPTIKSSQSYRLVIYFFSMGIAPRLLTNSDVAVFFLEILPSLPPGVLVHIHDIFLPLDYPPEWNDRFYSEQYMLAAMLLCRDRPFDVILPNCYVMSDPALSKTASTLMSGAGINPAPAVSFWIRTRTS